MNFEKLICNEMGIPISQLIILFFDNFQSSIMGILYEYFASGIADSGITQFGGDQCYNEIPPLYHWTISILAGTASIWTLITWGKHLINQKQTRPKLESNLLEKVTFWLGLVSLIMAVYYKVATKRGLFILNPCHITLLIMLVLLRTKHNQSSFMRKLHAIWTAWLFGAFGALYFPHLEDVSIGEFLLYYFEHLIIWPLGPIILHRRYGMFMPGFKDNCASFATFGAHQTLILVPLGRWLKVNLNFALCHSPAEPFFPAFGYHYFTIQFFNLCLISYIIRLVTYAYTKGFFWAVSRLTPGSPKKQT